MARDFVGTHRLCLIGALWSDARRHFCLSCRRRRD